MNHAVRIRIHKQRPRVRHTPQHEHPHILQLDDEPHLLPEPQQIILPPNLGVNLERIKRPRVYPVEGCRPVPMQEDEPCPRFFMCASAEPMHEPAQDAKVRCTPGRTVRWISVPFPRGQKARGKDLPPLRVGQAGGDDHVFEYPMRRRTDEDGEVDRSREMRVRSQRRQRAGIRRSGIEKFTDGRMEWRRRCIGNDKVECPREKGDGEDLVEIKVSTTGCQHMSRRERRRGEGRTIGYGI